MTIDLAQFGAWPGNDPAANAIGINNAIAYNISQGRNEIGIPMLEGVYGVDRTVGYFANADTDAKLHLYGYGRRGSCISWMGSDGGGPVVRWGTSSGNLRGIVMDNIEIIGQKATIGLDLEKASYNLFRNISIRDCDEWAIRNWNNANRNSFSDCWIQHLDDANAVMVTSGNLTFNHCLFGEDAGGLYVTSGRLILNNCDMYQCGWCELGPDPGNLVADMGGSGCIHVNNGSLRMSNCSMGVEGGQAKHLFLLKNPKEVRIYGSDLANSKADGNLFRYRSWGANSRLQIAVCSADCVSTPFYRTGGSEPSVVKWDSVDYNGPALPAFCKSANSISGVL